MITTLLFSRDNNVLASASNDCSISLWNFNKFTTDANLEEVNVTHNPTVQTDSESLLLATFRTKESPVLGIHFTRRNLLLAMGNQAPST
jgi:transcription initiation factor TFIID subunit 5